MSEQATKAQGALRGQRATNAQNVAVGALCVALGVLLPLVTHSIGAGTVLLPMHLPVLLCGFLCGPLYGLACGVLVPVLNCVLTGMPVAYPILPIVTCELCVYGVLSGVFYRKTPLWRKPFGIYAALLLTMVCGRAAYGGAWAALFFLNPALKAPTVIAAVVAGLPGIAVQLILLPPLVLAVSRGFRQNKQALAAAVAQIQSDKAACVVLRDGVVVKTAAGRGIAPILSLYDEGVLAGATVVDKIVGKAAAMVMTAGGVTACYALTVSAPARAWFRAHGVALEYDTCVDVIINRAGDGACPMEQTVKDLTDETEALLALRAKLEALQNG